MSLYKRKKLGSGFVHVPKHTYYEDKLKDLDKEGVPFTSPRYQSVFEDYKKAKQDFEKWSTGKLKDF